jgi:hypothetical protein
LKGEGRRSKEAESEKLLSGYDAESLQNCVVLNTKTGKYDLIIFKRAKSGINGDDFS